MLALLLITASTSNAFCQDSSFWGIDPHPDEMDDVPLFKDIGNDSYGIEYLNWDTVVPEEAIAAQGNSYYEWTTPDYHIKDIEAVNGTTLIKFWSFCPWATGDPVHEAPPKNGPPHDPDRYWNYWSDFVYELVERYDNDGIRDMRGLTYEHRYFQVMGESEAHFNGTKEQYIRVLELAHAAAKKANPNVVILYSSWNLGDYFDVNPSIEQINNDIVLMPEGCFVTHVLDHPQYFDLAPIQCNYDYTGIPSRVLWLRDYMQKKGYSRDIWFVDALTGYPLNMHIYQYTNPSGWNPRYNIENLPADVAAVVTAYRTTQENYDEVIVDILQEGTKRIPASDYFSVKKWWEKDKARFAFKKTVVAASFGIKQIFSQWIGENSQTPCIENSAWAGAGILSDDDPGIEAPKSTPRPLFYTIKVFNERLKGFTSAELLLPEQNKLASNERIYEEKWVIKFVQGGRDVYVMWSDRIGGGDTVNLSDYISDSHALVIHIVTELVDEENGDYDPVYRHDKVVPTGVYALTADPVIIAGTSDTLDPPGNFRLE